LLLKLLIHQNTRHGGSLVANIDLVADSLLYDVMFEIRELEGKGNGVVSTQPINAGAIILHEKALVRFKPDYVERYRGHTPSGTEGMLAATNFFLEQMSLEQQKKFLSLYGGALNSGPRVANYRVTAKRLWCVGLLATESERDLYVHVALVVNYNAFGIDGDVRIYEVASRFCHSCESNCRFDIVGDGISVRALASIQAGEELTLDYFDSWRMLPTHVRRFQWLEVKDFTCHCPRCDALGDDTRQFYCHKRRCPGHHAVCQPLNKGALRLPGITYTGVEYVEPHLLPCTVCQRSAPLEYQAAMFQLEKNWEAHSPMLTSQPTFLGLIFDYEPADTPQPGGLPALLQKLDELKYYVSHWVGFQLALHEIHARLVLYREGQKEHRARLLQLVTEMEPMLDCFFTVPRDQLSMFLMGMYAVYSVLGDSANAARLFRRLVRTVHIVAYRIWPRSAEIFREPFSTQRLGAAEVFPARVPSPHRLMRGAASSAPR
jgi:hypothetical protein